MFTASLVRKLLLDPLEQHLSKRANLCVRIGGVNVSPLQQSAELRDVELLPAGCPRDLPPLLSVGRIRVGVSVKDLRDLADGRGRLRSVAVERPVLRVVRRADGTSNLPVRRVREEAIKLPEQVTDQTREDSFALRIDRVLLVDGAVHVRVETPNDRTPFRLSSRDVVGDVQLTSTGDAPHYAATLFVRGLAAGEGAAAVNLGQFKTSATLRGTDDLTRVSESALEATGELDGADGTDLTLHLTADRLANAVLDFFVDGVANLPTLTALAPLPPVPPRLRGRLKLHARGTASPSQLRIAELLLTGTDLAATTAIPTRL